LPLPCSTSFESPSAMRKSNSCPAPSLTFDMLSDTSTVPQGRRDAWYLTRADTPLCASSGCVALDFCLEEAFWVFTEESLSDLLVAVEALSGCFAGVITVLGWFGGSRGLGAFTRVAAVGFLVAAGFRCSVTVVDDMCVAIEDCTGVEGGFSRTP
jgi:hypothetical protein